MSYSFALALATDSMGRTLLERHFPQDRSVIPAFGS
jgi:hypothetical protein